MTIETTLTWYSMNKELPDEKETVIIKLKDDGTIQAIREETKFFTMLNWCFDISEVEYWCYFPEFPEVE